MERGGGGEEKKKGGEGEREKRKGKKNGRGPRIGKQKEGKEKRGEGGKWENRERVEGEEGRVDKREVHSTHPTQLCHTLCQAYRLLTTLDSSSVILLSLPFAFSCHSLIASCAAFSSFCCTIHNNNTTLPKFASTTPHNPTVQ